VGKMTYEIEERSLFDSKSEFDKCHKSVKNHAKFIDKYVFKSFLFRSPEHLRIRLIKGKKEAVITRKSGTYHDIARKEQNQEIKLLELKNYLREIKSQGFKECVCFKTLSYAYELEGLRIDFNEITYLGNIVEIEALTEYEKDIPILKQKVSDMMTKLGLHKLEPSIYQKMIDNAYAKGLKSISKQNFSI
jgi:predicted adenylyl cyclase CyaB